MNRGLLSSCWGQVVLVRADHGSWSELLVELVGGGLSAAVNWPAFTGEARQGDRVLLNVTAVELGLGSGGYHFVLANLTSGGLVDRTPGHIIKLRYTPCQFKVLAVEEPASPYHEVLKEADTLDGLPVVVAGLHSMLPLVAAGLAAALGRPCRVVYVMMDGAALPLGFSRLIPALKEAGLLAGTISVGHAFGGDLEAVNVYSGLLAARHVLDAEVAVVGLGPGVVGTATRWGFSGVQEGEAINAAGSLEGRPLVVPRLSFADQRPRHQGLSHHTITVLSRVALQRALVALPFLPAEERETLLRQVTSHGLAERHTITWADGAPALRLLREEGLEVTTMGRSPEEDPAFFLAAGAGGACAAQLLGGAAEPGGRASSLGCG